MLSAFTARPLVELRPRDKSKIESLLAYGDRLLVGLNTGTVRIYRVNETPSSDQEAETNNEEGGSKVTTKPTDLLREVEKFARGRVEQMALIKEANLLVALAGGVVGLYDLQTFEVVEALARTKGAGCFAVTSDIHTDSEGVPSIVSRLAVAVKRRVLVWTWRDMELEVEPETGLSGKEMVLVSGIKTLTWASGTRLLAGLTTGYVLVDVVSKEVTDIVGPGSIGGAGGQDAGSGGGLVASMSMSYIGMGGTAPKPLATRLGEGEMMLSKDVNTHFITADGTPLGRRQIPWSAAPEAVGYSYPYLLALQDPSKGVLEVRNPETLSLLQSISLPAANTLHIPQPNISLAHAGKGFLVASDRVVWRMGALDYDAQIDELVEGGYLDEAISLLSMLEDALVTDKGARLREVKLRKARCLFEERKYRKALDLFTEVAAPPEEVISLYPRVIAGELTSVEESEEEPDGNGSEGNAESPPPEDKDKDKGIGNGKGMSYTPSVRSFLRTRTDNSSETSSVRPKEIKADKRLGMYTIKTGILAAVLTLHRRQGPQRRRLRTARLPRRYPPASPAPYQPRRHAQNLRATNQRLRQLRAKHPRHLRRRRRRRLWHPPARSRNTRRHDAVPRTHVRDAVARGLALPHHKLLRPGRRHAETRGNRPLQRSH